MELEEYKHKMERREYIAGGSETHMYMHRMSAEAQRITCEINGSYHTAEELRMLFSELTGKTVDETFRLFPPVYSDFGKNITVGKGVFINSGCCFQDQGGVTLGDNVLVGHQVVFATLNHDLQPERRAGMVPAPIVVKDNVWIGAHATILAGVTIGENAVVAAGAVVTKDVPANSVVGGVPARVIRYIAPQEQKNAASQDAASSSRRNCRKICAACENS